MAPTLATRLDRLEAHRAAADVVYAVGFTDNDAREVELCGTKERMTVDAFEQRYPQGLIIKWLEVEMWEAL